MQLFTREFGCVTILCIPFSFKFFGTLLTYFAHITVLDFMMKNKDKIEQYILNSSKNICGLQDVMSDFKLLQLIT